MLSDNFGHLHPFPPVFNVDIDGLLDDFETVPHEPGRRAHQRIGMQASDVMDIHVKILPMRASRSNVGLSAMGFIFRAAAARVRPSTRF